MLLHMQHQIKRVTAAHCVSMASLASNVGVAGLTMSGTLYS